MDAEGNPLCDDHQVREDAERWDLRYTGRVPGEPARPAGLEGIEVPGGGRCLDVACGLGEQSLWAAGLGFEVIALDASAVAIAALRTAGEQRGLAGRIDARVVDLDGGLPEWTSGSFDLVICQRFRDVRLYPQLAGALAPGGVLVVTVLSQVGAAEPGPFHAPPGELGGRFATSGLEVLRDEEGDGEATFVGRRSGGG